MRLRLPELLEERALTPYGLAQASGGRISMSLAYRIVREQGAFKCLTPPILEALCDVLKVEPDELFDREAKKPKRGR